MASAGLFTSLALTACSAPEAKRGADTSAEETSATGSAAVDTAAADTEQPCEAGYEVGLCAPDFALPEASGEPIALSDYAGSVVLLASEAKPMDWSGRYVSTADTRSSRLPTVR